MRVQQRGLQRAVCGVPPGQTGLQVGVTYHSLSATLSTTQDLQEGDQVLRLAQGDARLQAVGVQLFGD